MRLCLSALVFVCLTWLVPIGPSARELRSGKGNYISLALGLGTNTAAGYNGTQSGLAFGSGINLSLSHTAFLAMEGDACLLHNAQANSTVVAATMGLKVNLKKWYARAMILPGAGLGVGVFPNGPQGLNKINITFRGSWQLVLLRESKRQGGVFELGLLTTPGAQRGQGYTMPFLRIGYFG